MDRSKGLRRVRSAVELRPRGTPRRSYDPARALGGTDAKVFALLGLGVSPEAIARHVGLHSTGLERTLLRLREHFGVLGNAELAEVAARRRTEAGDR